MKYFLLFLSKCKFMQRMLGSLKFYVYTCICSTFTIYSQRIRLSCLMKQPLMIYRDTGFFEMCPKFFVLKMKFKSTNTSNLCLYECPTYKQVLTIVFDELYFLSQFRRKVCVKQGFLIYYPDHSEVKVIFKKKILI